MKPKNGFKKNNTNMMEEDKSKKLKLKMASHVESKNSFVKIWKLLIDPKIRKYICLTMKIINSSSKKSKNTFV